MIEPAAAAHPAPIAAPTRVGISACRTINPTMDQLRPERNPDADLLPPQRDDVGDDAVEAAGREDQRQDSEQPRGARHHPLFPVVFGSDVGECRDLRHRNPGIDVPDRLLQRGEVERGGPLQPDVGARLDW